jgi:two-component system cell cycle sensor histidine kinase/response regulator CckA
MPAGPSPGGDRLFALSSGGRSPSSGVPRARGWVLPDAATFEQPEGGARAEGRADELTADGRSRHDTQDGVAVHEIILDEAGTPVDYRFLDVNPAFERLTGLARSDVVGRTVREAIPEIEPAWIERYGRVALTGEPEQFVMYSGPLGRYFTVQAHSPRRGRFVAEFQDVTALHDRMAFAETIIASSSDGIVVYDRDLRVRVWNPAMERTTGVPAASVVGRRVEEAFPETTPGAVERLLRALAGETIDSVEVEYRFASSGAHGWFMNSYQPHHDRAGGIVGVIAICRDITARHEAEAALAESEAHFKTIFDNVADAIVIFEPGGRILMANRVICERLGYTPEKLRTMTIQELDDPDSAALFAKRIAGVMRRGYATFEVRHRRSDGSPVPLEVASRLIEYRGAPAILSVQRDISARLATEREEREHALFLQTLLDAIPVPITAKDRDGRIRLTNRAFTQSPGVLGRDAIGRTIDELQLPEIALHTAHDRAALAGEERTYEATMGSPDGPTSRVLYTKAPLRSPDGSVTGVVTAAIDITDRYAAEQALRESEARFRSLFDSASDGIFILGMDGRVLEVNRSGAETLGYTQDEMRGMSVLDFSPPENAANVPSRLINALERGSLAFESTHVRRNGELVPVELSVTAIDLGGGPALLGIARNISDRRRAEVERERADGERLELEERLRQSQKMEDIGRLAGGIAHDFNNLLTIIGGNADLALMALPPTGEPRSEIEQIKLASGRAAALTRQLLAFARRSVLQPEVVGLGDVVDRLEPMLRHLISEDIGLLVDTSRSKGCVLADPSQLEQVIFNLAVNARDAMPHGGDLRIVARDAWLDEETAGPLGLEPGQHSIIEVHDTGTGMDETTLEHLFEPFWTTKGPGRGTGLGLATVYGIVRQSGGAIAVRSLPELGATFTVYLPAVEGGRVGPAEAAGALAQKAATRVARILVVEDDDGVRLYAKRVLSAAGYDVVAASGGAGAMETIEGSPVQVLLTDSPRPTPGCGSSTCRATSSRT